jgi:tetratricopeptide (TPR) repeat protein
VDSRSFARMEFIMKAASKFIILVVAALVLLAFALRPNLNEHAAVLASEGRHAEAIAVLEHELSGAPHSPDLLAAIARSYAALGDVTRAAQSLNAYLDLRPDDVAAWESKAELLLQSGAMDGYRDVLSRLVAAQPTADRITYLAELLRLNGRVEDEISLLRAYAGKQLLAPAQLERLGGLLAERRDWWGAQKWLELADKVAPPDRSAGRFMLLEVLIETKKPDRIDDRGQRWMTDWRSPFLSGKLVLRIAQAGFTASAYKLAVEFSEAFPDQALDMAGLLAVRGRRDIAREVLVRWSDRAAKPTGSQLREFVQASALVGDVGVPLIKLAGLARGSQDADGLGEMLDSMSDAFGASALAAIRPLLPPDVFRRQPLFGARLALFENNREMARQFLNRIEPTKLSSAQLANWLTLVQRTESDNDVVKRLMVLWDSGRLPRDLMPEFANAAMRSGQPSIHDMIWDSARH